MAAVYIVLFTRACKPCYMFVCQLKYDKTKFINDLQQRKTGTHVHAFSLIKDAMIKTRHPDLYWFKNKFKHLKDLRIKADYKEETVTFSEGNNALSMATAINNIINKL